MEHRLKCNVCGKIWCFSDADIKNNINNSALSGLAAIGGIASALGGTTAQQHLNYDISERSASKVVDYWQCPSCHSKDYTVLTQEEWEELQLRESFANTRISVNSNATPEALIKRAKLFLEDKDWASANAYCDNVLDTDPEYGLAYVYKLMAELRASTLDELGEQKKPFGERPNYQKALRFADKDTVQALGKQLERTCNHINEQKYENATILMGKAGTESDYQQAANQFGEISGYKDAGLLRERCLKEAERLRENAIKEKVKGSKTAYIAAGVVLAIIGGVMFIGGFIPNFQSDGLTTRVLLLGGWTGLLAVAGVLLAVAGTQNKKKLLVAPAIMAVLAIICFVAFFTLTYA